MIATVRNVVRWFLAVILMFAGAAKLVQLDTFRATLERTGFVSATGAEIVSVVLPPVEIALAILLVLALFNQIIIPAALMLSLCFTGVHAYTLWYGAIDCGCFGLALQSGQREWFMFGISFAMLVSSLTLVLIGPPRKPRMDDDRQPLYIPAAPGTD